MDLAAQVAAIAANPNERMRISANILNQAQQLEEVAYNASPQLKRTGIYFNQNTQKTTLIEFKMINELLTIPRSVALNLKCLDPDTFLWNLNINQFDVAVAADRAEKYILSPLELPVTAGLWVTGGVPIAPELAISSLVFPFCIVPGFAYCYHAYSLNPDAGVAIALPIDGRRESQHSIDLRNRYVVDGGVAYTRAEIMFVLHISVQCMFKNFATQEHAQQFKARRLVPFNNSSGLGTVTAERANVILPNATLMEIQRAIAGYPKLRTALISFVISRVGNSPLSHSRTLLANVGNTTTVLITSFLMCPRKTRAHYDPVILNETLAFIAAVTRIANNWGNNAPYVRAIDPEDQSLALSNWPNLGYAAYLYNCVLLGQAMQNYRMARRGVTLTGISYLLSQRLPANMAAEGAANRIQELVDRNEAILRPYNMVIRGLDDENLIYDYDDNFHYAAHRVENRVVGEDRPADGLIAQRVNYGANQNFIPGMNPLFNMGNRGIGQGFNVPLQNPQVPVQRPPNVIPNPNQDQPGPNV